MSPRYALLCLAVATFHANAADAPLTGQPSVQRAALPANASVSASGESSMKPRVAIRMAAPLVSETRAVRAADGSIRLNCTDQPNPKARAINAKINAANAKAPKS
jgi:hypothetical protein